MKVVTLPITPATGRSFVTLLSPLVVDLVAYSLRCEPCIMLNTIGITKSSVQSQIPESLVTLFRDHLDRLGIAKQTPCLHDGSQEFENYFRDALDRLIKKGHVKEAQMDISACVCGRVEIPTNALGKIVGEYRRKKLIQMSPSGLVCSVCSAPLTSGQETVALCYFQAPQRMRIFPSLFEKEMHAAISRITSYPMVISRNHRSSTQITVGGYTGSADVDFRWTTFLGHAIPDPEDGMLVTSAATLSHAVRVLLLDQLLTEKERCTIVVHPLIRIRNQQTNFATLSAETFLAQCGIPYVARTFLTLGLRWDTMEGIIDSGNFHLVQKSLYRGIQMDPNGRSSVALDEIPRFFSRQALLNLLKKCRNNNPLTEEEKVLLGFLEPRS